MRAIEIHLDKYPNSPRKLELERALVKVAIELKDDDRIVKYGERILQKEPDDAQILEKVTTSLLRKGGHANAEQALKYATHLQELLQSATNEKTSSAREEAKFKDGADRASARALILRARAEGLLEHNSQAADLAEAEFFRLSQRRSRAGGLALAGGRGKTNRPSAIWPRRLPSRN